MGENRREGADGLITQSLLCADLTMTTDRHRETGRNLADFIPIGRENKTETFTENSL